MVELRFHAAKRALRAERPDVQLVDHRLRPLAAFPGGILPLESSGIDDLARPMHVERVVARRGIGHQLAAVDAIAVAQRLRPRTVLELEPPAVPLRHRDELGSGGGFEAQVHGARGGRPQPEPNEVASYGGTERHIVAPYHRPRLNLSSASERPCSG